MNSPKSSAIKSISVIALSLFISIMIISPQSTGDISAQGLIKITQTVTGPPIVVIPPQNFTNPPKGTFVWNYSMYNDTLTGVLRVHVNFNQTDRTYYWNDLELINTGNVTGSFNVTIVQWVKMGSVYYYDNYTKYVSVYMSHTWQTNSSPGIRLYNNTETGPFPLYPSNMTSYFIGLTYTPPVYPVANPAPNSFGEYVQFTFTIHY